MNTVGVFKILSFVVAIWPTISKVVPLVVRAVLDVANKDLDGSAKKAAVVSAVRALVPVTVVPDALLNWIIETVVQILRKKEGK